MLDTNVNANAVLRSALRFARIGALLAIVLLLASTASSVLGWWLVSSPAYAMPIGDDRSELQAATRSGPVLDHEARVVAKGEAAASISSRNLFCPTCRPQPSGTDGAPQVPQIQDTELPLRLVATMQSDDPAESMATIQVLDTGRLGVFQPGEAITDTVSLHRVERGRVLLAHAQLDASQPVTTLERLAFPDKAPPPKKRGRNKAKKKKRKSKYELPGARDAINCKGTSCTVKRKFVAQLLANPAKLNRQAKFKTYRKGGKRGFKIYRVRRGTIGNLLGLRSGDLLTAVNGQPLDSVDRVMALYTKLRRARHLTLDFEHKGETKTLDLTII